MGFLSKLMKNPIVQMALPMMLTGGATSLFSGTGVLGGSKLGLGLGSMFSGMNPMMANALKQSMLGYGTGVLSGSKRPAKSAMYAGLTSIPFSYMSAANAAKAYNQSYANKVPMTEGVVGQKPVGPPGRGYMDDVMGQVPVKDFKYKSMTPWEILSKNQEAIDRSNLIKEKMPDADIFSKPIREKMVSGDDVFMAPTGEFKTDWLPTAASQAAALYGGMDTPEEEWESTKKKRRKELAFMYGVPEEMIEGEFDNPWNTGAFMNSGGIASLDMDDGGGVSGPGTGTSDSIDAKLSDGEFVMTAKAVENLGGGDRYEGARKMYDMMNMLDPESESMSEVV